MSGSWQANGKLAGKATAGLATVHSEPGRRYTEDTASGRIHRGETVFSEMALRWWSKHFSCMH